MEEQTINELCRLSPELMQPLIHCALLLERISVLQPVGRRALASRLHMSEREVRALADDLKKSGYIEIGAGGMTLTENAIEPLKTAQSLVKALRALSALESQIASRLPIDRVIICAGDSDEDSEVLQEIGKAAALALTDALQDGMTLAITGGSTVAAVARNINAARTMNIDVIPARGGLGRNVETQADTLAALIAGKFGGRHRLMQLPDTLTPAAQREILKLPQMVELTDMLHDSDILLYGIGRADKMADNRRLSRTDIGYLAEHGAIAEAYGYYFDPDGHPVRAATSVGLSLDDIEHIPHIMAVAGGASKAEAILAVMRRHRHDLLVTDEGAARRMLELMRGSA